jgi:MFS family permease
VVPPEGPSARLPARRPLFHGWRIVAVAFFVDFVAVGFFFYSYGVFFKSIAAEFGDSRLGVALGLTVTQTIGALAAPLIGRALDRYPIRRVIAAGTIAMSLGFALLSRVETATQFYVVLGLFIGFGASSMGGLATAKLVANWFERRRGTALGVAATGISLSGVVMPAVTALLIGAAGWRSAFLLYAAFAAFVVLPVVLRYVVSRPADLGLSPDGRAGPRDATAPTVAAVPTRLWARRDFWVLVTTIGLLFCCQSATLTHLVPRVTDMGYTLLEASAVMSVCAGAGVVGKLVFGALADRMAARSAVLIAIGSQVLGQTIMLWGPGYSAFAAGAAAFGFGMGGIVPLQGALVARHFGIESFGRALGLMRPAMLPLQVIGVPFAGWMFDATGRYDGAFQVLLAVYVLAAWVVAAGGRSRLAA